MTMAKGSLRMTSEGLRMTGKMLRMTLKHVGAGVNPARTELEEPHLCFF
jgi:hypothetical protein